MTFKDGRMSVKRWLELDTMGGTLTVEEIRDGWHFCPEWDGMLIHKSWPEYQSCTCQDKE